MTAYTILIPPDPRSVLSGLPIRETMDPLPKDVVQRLAVQLELPIVTGELFLLKNWTSWTVCVDQAAIPLDLAGYLPRPLFLGPDEILLALIPTKIVMLNLVRRRKVWTYA